MCYLLRQMLPTAKKWGLGIKRVAQWALLKLWFLDHFALITHAKPGPTGCASETDCGTAVVQAGQHVAQIAVTVTVTGLRSKVQWALGIRNQIILEMFILFYKLFFTKFNIINIYLFFFHNYFCKTFVQKSF